MSLKTSLAWPMETLLSGASSWSFSSILNTTCCSAAVVRYFADFEQDLIQLLTFCSENECNQNTTAQVYASYHLPQNYNITDELTSVASYNYMLLCMCTLVLC